MFSQRELLIANRTPLRVNSGMKKTGMTAAMFVTIFAAAGAQAAQTRMPYEQAYAICRGRAAQAPLGSSTLLINPGLIGSLIAREGDSETRTIIMNGCLAEFGWIVR